VWTFAASATRVSSRPMKLGKLDRQDRMRLMKFVCSFAWADLEIADQERRFVQRMIERLGLKDDEKKEVMAWLVLPPRVEEVDPEQVPFAHRELFLQAAREIIAADGTISEEERENLSLLEQLLGKG
jgi:uncharacterized tellurite resistance protein B-like protein